jgi:hypothetical protein
MSTPRSHRYPHTHQLAIRQISFRSCNELRRHSIHSLQMVQGAQCSSSRIQVSEPTPSPPTGSQWRASETHRQYVRRVPMDHSTLVHEVRDRSSQQLASSERQQPQYCGNCGPNAVRGCSTMIFSGCRIPLLIRGHPIRLHLQTEAPG